MSDRSNSTIRGRKRIWILPILVVAGLVLAIWQPFGMDELLAWGQRFGSSPVFLTATVMVIAVLFTFGLPGSLGLWLIAPFNPPVVATLLLVAASTGGAVGAYFFSAHLRKDWRPAGASARVVEMLEKRSDLLTQTAMRMLPGFPHSVVNFAGGVLRLPLPGFIVAAIVGLSIKWGIYASAINGMVDAVVADTRIGLGTLLPLFGLVVLALAGAWVRRRMN